MLLLVVLCGSVGLAVGSFLNVVVWRVPRGESVVSPASACPACSTPIRPRDNVPVLSWLLLHARCRDCGQPISARYPLVELLTSALFVIMALRFGFDAALPAYLYLAAVGVALALIDINVRKLPDVLTLPSYLVVGASLGAGAALGSDSGHLVRALVGGGALYAVYLALRLAYPAGMGCGDVKLAGVLGMATAWLGWGAWSVALFGGFLLGGIWGLGLVLAGRAGRKSKVPYGPFMLAGALAAILVGQPLADAYLRLTVG